MFLSLSLRNVCEKRTWHFNNSTINIIFSILNVSRAFEFIFLKTEISRLTVLTILQIHVIYNSYSADKETRIHFLYIFYIMWFWTKSWFCNGKVRFGFLHPFNFETSGYKKYVINFIIDSDFEKKNRYSIHFDLNNFDFKIYIQIIYRYT